MAGKILFTTFQKKKDVCDCFVDEMSTARTMDGKQKGNLAKGFLAGREITPLFLLSLNKRGLTDYNLEAKLFKSSLFAEEIFYLLKIGKYAKKISYIFMKLGK